MFAGKTKYNGFLVPHFLGNLYMKGLNTSLHFVHFKPFFTTAKLQSFYNGLAAFDKQGGKDFRVVMSK